jgi:hypothetical protein
MRLRIWDGSRTSRSFIKHKETSDVDASDSQDHGLVGLLVDLLFRRHDG